MIFLYSASCALKKKLIDLLFDCIQNLKISLLQFFAKALGDEFTPLSKEAWDKVLGFIVTKIGEGLKSVEA